MSEPTKNTRVKDEVHAHDNAKWGFSDDMNQFVTEVQKKFPGIRITSGKRSGDGDSHHHTGNAVDIGVSRSTDTDAVKMYNWLMNTEEGLSLMSEHGLGVIDETDPSMLAKTGGTGPHFHIGKDSKFSAQTNERYLQFDSYYTYSGREGAKYRKDADGNWMINLGDQTKNEYVKIEDPTGERTNLLNKQAVENKVVPPPVKSFYEKNPGYDYGNSYSGGDSDLNLDIYAPEGNTGFQIGTPEFNFIQDVMKENKQLKEEKKKSEESDARKVLEEKKKLKALEEKQRQEFIIDAISSIKPYESPNPRSQSSGQPLNVDSPTVDFQSQYQLPSLPGMSKMPQFIEGENPKFEEGGVVTSYGWQYKKEGDQYLTRREGSENWIEAKGQALDAIKQKVFNETEYTAEDRKADYKNMVQGLIDDGNSIDDLVAKKVGTRSGLMSMFGDQLKPDQPTTEDETQPDRGGNNSFNFPDIHGDLYKKYAGAMTEVFKGGAKQAKKSSSKPKPKERTENRFVQPDITMTDWESAPTGSNEKETGDFVQPDITRGDWQEKPKEIVAGKQDEVAKKQQDLFDKTFAVSEESNMQKAKTRVDEHIQNTKEQFKEQGKEFTDKDKEKAISDAWFSEGVMNLAQLNAKKRAEEIERLTKERTPYLLKLLGEDKAANFTNYANRLLIKQGLMDADGEVIDIKETDKVKMQGPTPDVFYEEIKTVKDELSPVASDSLVSYRNQWDNSKGFTYINTPAKGSDRKRTQTYNNVEGVGHFILDASPLRGHTYMHGNNFNFISKAIENDEYLPVYENIPGPGGKVNMKYKKPSEMTEEELSALNKFKEYNNKAISSGANRNLVASQYAKAIDDDRFKIVSPLRQLGFDDINFDSSKHATGFKKARVVTTNDGKPTYLLFTNQNKDAYGRFDGVTVSFIFKDKHGNTIVRDYTGPVKGIQEEGKSIKEKYGLKDGDLSVGYHDVGSFSGKPKAKDGKLSVSQWDGFNDEDGTGSALIIPK